VSIRAVAFVPCAPLLIPQVAGGSAHLDKDVRAAGLRAVASAIGGGPDEVVVVAPAAPSGEWAQDSTWDFSGFGVARLPSDPRPTLPWALGIGAWLLDECGWEGSRRYLGVGPSSISPGLELSAGADLAVVVVGDGSARRSERAPGHHDERAEPFDRTVADLLARGDSAGLGRLDPTVAGQLMCAGAPTWAWLAGVLDGAAVADAELMMHIAPYGVGYFVARWALS
jgi:hypothetical protein